MEVFYGQSFAKLRSLFKSFYFEYMKRVAGIILFCSSVAFVVIAAYFFYEGVSGFSTASSISTASLVQGAFLSTAAFFGFGSSAYFFRQERREVAERARQVHRQQVAIDLVPLARQQAHQQQVAIELAQVVGREAPQQNQANQPPTYAIDAPANGVNLQGYNVLNQPPSYSDYLEDGAPMRPAEALQPQDSPPSHDSIVALQNQDPRSQAYLEQGSQSLPQNSRPRRVNFQHNTAPVQGASQDNAILPNAAEDVNTSASGATPSASFSLDSVDVITPSPRQRDDSRSLARENTRFSR